MRASIAPMIDGFANLFFPHTCEGCGTDITHSKAVLCAACAEQLPETVFIREAGNPVEQKFFGQLTVAAAGSAFFFTKQSLLQHLVKQLKYHGNRETGHYLGALLGHQLSQTNRFDSVDVIVPLPLNWKKEKRRGYNQAAIIAEGITSVWKKPILYKAVARNVFTETQTHKDRITRWQSMQGVFTVTAPGHLAHQHVLLVDDIITTGATLEACGESILAVSGTKLSIATVAYTI